MLFLLLCGSHQICCSVEKAISFSSASVSKEKLTACQLWCNMFAHKYGAILVFLHNPKKVNKLNLYIAILSFSSTSLQNGPIDFSSAHSLSL